MAYTQIQCIGYQVPTVAKVFDNTEPTDYPTMPDAVTKPASEIQNSANNNYIEIYNESTNQLVDSPDKDTETSNYKAWKKEITPYLGRLMKYLEAPNNTDQDERNKAQACVTYLKYYTRWGDWTIPSTTATGGDVDIIQVNNEDAYRLKGSDSYFTNTKYIDDLTADAKNRVIRFLNVLYRAANNNHYDNNHNYNADSNNNTIDTERTTLKVFTAPEFYFRPENTITGSDVYSAYTYTVYKAMKEVLRQTIKGMGLNHWLIVPGTIMWYMPANTTAHNKTVDENTYFNSCIYMYNYPGYVFNQQTSQKLEKSIASHIDGVPYNEWDYGNNAPKVLLKYINNDHLEKHLFDIDSVKTGLEICLEHTKGATHTDGKKYGILKHLITHENKSRPDLQLLVSGGMPIKDYSIALKDQGVFFRNDGLSQDSTHFDTYVYAANYDELSNLLMDSGGNHEISLDNNAAFELRSPLPNPPGALELLNGMSFDQQKIVISPSIP